MAGKERSTPGIRKRTYRRKDGSVRTSYTPRVSYRNGAGKRVWVEGRSFPTLREAKAALVRMAAALQAGTFVAPSSMTVTEYVETHWLPMIKRQVKRSTFTNYERNWRRHIKPAVGELRLQGVLPLHLDGLYGDLAIEREVEVTKPDGSTAKRTQRALKAKTIQNVHLQVSKLFRDAEQSELVARNPADRANPPRVMPSPEDEIKAWDAEELQIFLRHVRSDWWYPFMRLAAMSGMRRGEVLGLRWSDLDFDRGSLAVRQAVVADGYATYLDTPKSHRPRTIDLDPKTMKALRRRRREQLENRLAAGDGYLASDLVFTKADGSLVHPDTFTQAFDRKVEQTGLRRITLHGLRHTHATLLLKAGVPVQVVSQRLGHSDPGFTLRLYGHVLPSMQADAVNKITRMVDG
jgi:integrase